MIVHGDAMVTVRRDHCSTLLGAHERVAEIDPEQEEYAVYRVLDALTDSFFPSSRSSTTSRRARGGRRRRAPTAARLQQIVSPQAHADSAAPHGRPAARHPRHGRHPVRSRCPASPTTRPTTTSATSTTTCCASTTRSSPTATCSPALLDVYLSAQSNRLNDVITRLTVVGTIFLPLTFLTGFFGQNFGWLVDHVDAPAPSGRSASASRSSRWSALLAVVPRVGASRTTTPVGSPPLWPWISQSICNRRHRAGRAARDDGRLGHPPGARGRPRRRLPGRGDRGTRARAPSRSSSA